MKINYIKIYNISSYVGECYFDFTVSKDNNIILIGGQNGTGKTSLFTAIKLALYGHLNYNYQSVNAQYLNKVKEIINHDAFTSSEVKAYVEIQIDIPNEREVESFIIHREWNYISQKINEEVDIYRNNYKMKKDEIIFFQNYLFTIAPPNLFDFFFFDSEQIGDFFETNKYNDYIKNALLTLCSFDTFELIRKFSDNYISGNDDSEEINEITFKYKEIVNQMDSLVRTISICEANIAAIENEITSVVAKKEELDVKFKNAGGLTIEDREALLKESNEHEKLKNESSVYIKSFVEGLMPFFIAKNIAFNITTQLIQESEVKKYHTLREKLNSFEIINAVKKTMENFEVVSQNQEFITELINAIGDAVKPDIDVDNFNYLHDLSTEQHNKVEDITRKLKKFNVNGILKKIEIKEESLKHTIQINKTLREAMPEMDATLYIEKTNQLANDEIQLSKKRENLVLEQEQMIALSEDLRVQKTQTFERLKEKTKNRNVYELSNKMSMLMNNMIQDLTSSKFKQIEKLMLEMLKKIMRKDNFIDLVELDNNFNIFLYKEQPYQYSELTNLINNIGPEELARRVGKKGVSKLVEIFGIRTIAQLQNRIKNAGEQISLFDGTSINLYKKIEFGQLSKGEKQIFVLSLYWAIIKSSGKEIPFIIDTPYARIDTEHREQISKEFFPSISDQVVILSTDEEITENYYDVLKPYISKEYLLQYNETESKTVVCDGYFFKE